MMRRGGAVIVSLVVVAGLVLHPRATVMAASLSAGLALIGARRVAIALVVALVVAALAGLRVDALPPART